MTLPPANFVTEHSDFIVWGAAVIIVLLYGSYYSTKKELKTLKNSKEEALAKKVTELEAYVDDFYISIKREIGEHNNYVTHRVDQVHDLLQEMKLSLNSLVTEHNLLKHNHFRPPEK